MSSFDPSAYYTSGRRDGSRRDGRRHEDGQQLPPLRHHLPEFFPGPELPGSRSSRNVSYDCPSQPERYTPSQESTPSPYIPVRRYPEPDNSHPSRARPGGSEVTPLFAMYNQDMVRQRESDHPAVPSRPARASSGGATRRFQCELCDERFDRPSGLEIHMRSHTQKKPYTCSQPGCSKSFTVRSNLNRHERTHNADSAFEPADDGHSHSAHFGNATKPSKMQSSTYYTSSR